jgi:hypothetical protein
MPGKKKPSRRKAPTKPKTPTKSEAPAEPKAPAHSDGPVDTIKVRMYNTGSVGDCFLILFQKKEEIVFKMMIDCGGIKTTADKVTPCVEDIAETCGGHIDLLLVTHQHEDHLSGFNLARPVFDKLTVGETWMSWVEDPSDPLGQLVKKKYGKKLKELTSSIGAHLAGKQNLAPSDTSHGARQRYIRENLAESMQLLEFEAGMQHGKGLAAGARTNDDAMKYCKTKGKKLVYRKPGEVLTMPNADGIRFYVLGPPRDPDLKFLKIEMNPDEMYHLALAATSTDTPPPVALLSEIESLLADNQSPFAPEFALRGPALSEFWHNYGSRAEKWRQIEEDWKESDSDMALALTRLTNNTSLAIALEFVHSGVVVLLPADAQSGNWMSWHKPDVVAAFKKQEGKETKELLKNTVFYKVGHHSSHNGTASLSGLELMTNNNLVAFIPLVQDKVPAAWGGAKNFPAAKLYPKIIASAKGRVVRTDQGIVTDATAATLRKQLSAADQENFKKNYRPGKCYFEYTITG